MSDTSQGPDWWQASDGKWYPPDQASGGDSGAQFAGAGAGGGAVPASTSGTGAGVQSQWGTLAEWPQRAVGLLIDLAVIIGLIIVGAIVTAVVGAVSDVLGLLLGLVLYVAALGAWLYFSYLVGVTGQSPGMRLTGLKCVGEETGQPIGAGMGIVRYFAHIVDSVICYIGWLFPLWDDKKQTIADKLLKTVVVAGAPKQQFGPELFKP